MAYWQVLATLVDIEELESGDIPGARYVIAEPTVRYKAPVLFEDTLHSAASICTIGNRSYVMGFELRAGKTFEEGFVAAEGSAAHVFYNLEKGGVKPRPDWFLSAAAELDGTLRNLSPPKEAAERETSQVGTPGETVGQSLRRSRWSTRRLRERRSPRWAWVPTGSREGSVRGPSSVPSHWATGT